MRLSIKKVSHLKKIVPLCFFSLTLLVCHAQPDLYRIGKIKHRISVGPVVSKYKNNSLHTINTKAKPGFCLSYKTEVFLGKKTNLLLGLDYFNQGLSFNGYYSTPGHTYLFDKTFSYKHELRIQEFQLPIGVKIAFNQEKVHFYTPYLMLGVGVRYIFSSYAIITNDSTGNTVYDDKASVDFQYQFVAKGLNAFFHGGLGIQSNFRKTGGAAFFEIIYKYGISRLHYTGFQNSNDLYIKDAHIGISIGVRF